jgi:acyl-coenzyme A thioesterase PaaI-like protein
MEITDIPFAQTLGLKKSADGVLELGFDDGVMNHLQTIAAAAQFSLAELASGEYLMQVFPELIDKVVPVLRDSRVKYKRPANSSISAYASSSDKDIAKFKEHYDRKGRSLLSVNVEVKDTAGNVVSAASFSWYIQKT